MTTEDQTKILQVRADARVVERVAAKPLSDTELVLLSAASQREDGLTCPDSSDQFQLEATTPTSSVFPRGELM